MNLDHATYDPTDDKVRVYFASRQPDESLAPLKEAGYRWAPRLACWYATWTPAREDAALAATETDGLDDEPTNIEDRAEDRADRFRDYAGNAAEERDRRHNTADALADAMNGQPVLIGHHSEKRHRRDLARMGENMRKAHHAERRRGYWSSRANGSVRWAKTKEGPSVRARRIKGLEADLRRNQRTEMAARGTLAFLATATLDQAIAWAGVSPWANCRLYDALQAMRRQPEGEARTAAFRALVEDRVAGLKATLTTTSRWIEHIEGRLAYEREQLAAQGGTHLLEPKPRNKGKAAIPLVDRGPDHGHPITKAEWAKIHKDYRGTTIVEHEGRKVRVRTCLASFAGQRPGSGLVEVTFQEAKP